MNGYNQREVFWIIDRMTDKIRLDLSKTFEEQKDLVNRTIIPNVMKSIDLNTFPIVDDILYNMIHERHRHQRESYKLKGQTEKI